MEPLHHRREVRHVAPADQAGRVRQAVGMRVVRRPQQQRRRVHRAARHDEQRRARPGPSRRCARPRRLRPSGPRGSVISRRAQRVGPQRHVRPLRSPGGRSRRRRRSSREACTGTSCRCCRGCSRPPRPAAAARAAAATDAAPARRSCSTISAIAGACGTGWYGKRSARRLGRIDAVLPAHVIQALGAVVVRRERVVVDRPGRRDAVDVLDRLEVLAPQPVEHAAPELGVAADAVVRVRAELAAALVEPALRRSGSGRCFQTASGIPVLVFLRHEVAALEDQDARAGCRPARAPSCRRRRRCR